MREVLLPQEMVHTGDLILVNAQFPFRGTGTDRFLLPASFGGNRVLLDGRVARLLEKLVLDLGGGEALCPVSGWLPGGAGSYLHPFPTGAWSPLYRAICGPSRTQRTPDRFSR